MLSIISSDTNYFGKKKPDKFIIHLKPRLTDRYSDKIPGDGRDGAIVALS